MGELKEETADQPKFFLAWTRAVQVGKINMNYEKTLKGWSLSNLYEFDYGVWVFFQSLVSTTIESM